MLAESGMSVALEQRVSTARGRAVIDVRAEEELHGRHYVIFVECKHWSSPIPQGVIHAFRTVVADAGANIGYVVSSNGFQPGAIAAADLTNLRLVTWEEFQVDFEKAWIEHHLLRAIDERLDPLLRYTEALVPRSFVEVDDAAVAKLKDLRARHGPLGWLMTGFTTPGYEMRRGVPALPLREHMPSLLQATANLPNTILDVSGYREFLDAALRHGEAAIDEFEAVLRTGGAAVTAHRDSKGGADGGRTPRVG